jgi:ankyrin repeat protein
MNWTFWNNLMTSENKELKKPPFLKRKRSESSSDEEFKKRRRLDLFSGRLSENDQNVIFQRKIIFGDGNCGLNVLNTDRKEFAETLLSLSQYADVREHLWHEIYQAFSSKELPPPPEWERLLDQSSIIHLQWDELIRTLRDNITEATNFNGNQIKELINWLTEHHHLDWAERLKETNSAIVQAEEALRLYCSSKEIYEEYARSYISNQQRLWVGHDSALLYARVRNITLYIWESSKENPEKLKLRNHTVAKNPQRVIHLYYPSGSFHFDLLIMAGSINDESTVEMTSTSTPNSDDSLQVNELPNEMLLRINKYLDPKSAFRFFVQVSEKLRKKFQPSFILESHLHDLSIESVKTPSSFFNKKLHFYLNHFTEKYNEAIAQLLLEEKITEKSLFILKNRMGSEFPKYVRAITSSFIRKIMELARRVNLTADEVMDLFTDKHVIESNASPFTILLFYAKRNNISALKKLLPLKVFSSVINHIYNRSGLIHYLIADIDLITDSGYKPVEYETLMLLLEYGLRVNVMTHMRYTPLYISAYIHANSGLVSLLLKRGAQDNGCYNGKNAETQITRVLAGQEWNSYLEYIRKTIAIINEEGKLSEHIPYFLWFCSQQQYQVASDWGVYLETFSTIFDEIIKELNTVLKSEDLVTDHMDRYKIEEVIKTIKFLSTYNQRIRNLKEIKNLLIQYRENNITFDLESAFNYERRSWLHHACLKYDEKSIEEAVSYGADVEVRDENNMTPLMLLTWPHGGSEISTYHWYKQLGKENFEIFKRFLFLYQFLLNLIYRLKRLEIDWVAFDNIENCLFSLENFSTKVREAELLNVFCDLLEFLKENEEFFRERLTDNSEDKQYLIVLKRKITTLNNIEAIKLFYEFYQNENNDHFKKILNMLSDNHFFRFGFPRIEDFTSVRLLDEVISKKDKLPPEIQAFLATLRDSVYKTKYEYCVDILMGEGADLNAEYETNGTILSLVAKDHQYHKLSYLFKRGLRFTHNDLAYFEEMNIFHFANTLEAYKRTKSNNSIFHFLCESNESWDDQIPNILRKLIVNYRISIRGQEDINNDPVMLKDNNEETPLFYAVRNNKIDLVYELIYLGADIHHRNKMGQTIFDIAQNISDDLRQLLNRLKTNNNILHHILIRIYELTNNQEIDTDIKSALFLEKLSSEEFTANNSLIGLFLNIFDHINIEDTHQYLLTLISCYFESVIGRSKEFFYELKDIDRWKLFLSNLTKCIIHLYSKSINTDEILKKLFLLDDIDSFTERVNELDIDQDFKEFLKKNVYSLGLY